MSTDLITELADQVEDLIGTGNMFSLRIDPGEPADTRALIIDTHGAVLDELRRRGREDVHGTIEHIRDGETGPDGMPLLPGEYLVIGVPPETD
jgi:hypothetical protein